MVPCILLLAVFGMINAAERAGTGVSEIYSIWEKEGFELPTLIEQFNPERTTITLSLSPIGDKSAIKIGDKSAIKANGTGEEIKQKIIDYITDHGFGKSTDISKILNLKSSRTKDYLAMLVSDGVLITEGANRNRVYRIRFPKH